MPFLQFTLYKIHKICIFIQKNLHITKKSNTFAPNFKNKPIKSAGNTINTAKKL